MSAPFVDMKLEAALIGACMNDDGLALRLSQHVQPRDFYDPRHAAAFATYRDAEVEGSHPDLRTAVAGFCQRYNSSADDAIRFLADLQIGADANMLEHWAVKHALKIAHKAKARRVAQRFDKMARIASECDEDGYLEQAAAFDIGEMTDDGMWMREFVTTIRDKANGKITRSRIHSTGIASIDDATNGGLRDGAFIVVGGMPGSGKSAMVGQWAAVVAESKQGAVLLATLEMDGEQTTSRIIGSLTGAPAARFDRGDSTDCRDWWDILERASELPIMIMDRAPLTIDDVRSRAKLLKSTHGLAMVAVDYLHLLDGPGKDSLERLTNITRRCKQMASELQCPVVLLSSFNRTAFDVGKPSMKNFRGSGSIESDATLLMVVHRQHLIDQNVPENQAQIHILKNRNGTLGEIPLRYNGRCLMYTDWDQPDPEDARMAKFEEEDRRASARNDPTAQRY